MKFLCLFEHVQHRWFLDDEENLGEALHQPYQPGHDLAVSYARAHQMPDPVASHDQPVPQRLMQDLGDEFEDTPDAVTDPKVQAAYATFCREIMAQAQWILSTGLDVEPYMMKGEPYPSSQAMIQDISQNHHLYFLRTAGGFGGSSAGGQITRPANLLLKKSGLTLHGYQLDYNEVIRWVHDFFGHAAEGNQFGPRGEYNAFLKHSQLFSQEAQQPLIAELLMQAGWFFHGRHIRRADRSVPKKGDVDYLPPQQRPFVDPKNVLPSEQSTQRVKQYVDALRRNQNSPNHNQTTY